MSGRVLWHEAEVWHSRCLRALRLEMKDGLVLTACQKYSLGSKLPNQSVSAHSRRIYIQLPLFGSGFRGLLTSTGVTIPRMNQASALIITDSNCTGDKPCGIVLARKVAII